MNDDIDELVANLWDAMEQKARELESKEHDAMIPTVWLTAATLLFLKVGWLGCKSQEEVVNIIVRHWDDARARGGINPFKPLDEVSNKSLGD